MDAQVIIAGAGPVGLMLAAELRLHGVAVLVLDPLEQPSAFGKAFGLHSRSTETMALRGLVGPLTVAAGARPARQFGGVVPPGLGPGPGLGAVSRTHFAGIRTIRLDQLDTAYPGMLGVSQESVEFVLAGRAGSSGAEIRRGRAVAGIARDDDGVTVTTTGPAGSDRLRAQYLVGCDGGHSAVRKLAGFAFPGTDPTITGRLVEAAVPALFEDPGMGWHRTADGVLQVLPGRVLAVEFDGPPADRGSKMDGAEMLDSIRRITGRDAAFAAEPTSLFRFTDNTRLAAVYRDGRVLLAGEDRSGRGGPADPSGRLPGLGRRRSAGTDHGAEHLVRLGELSRVAGGDPERRRSSRPAGTHRRPRFHPPEKSSLTMQVCVWNQANSGDQQCSPGPQTTTARSRRADGKSLIAPRGCRLSAADCL